MGELGACLGLLGWTHTAPGTLSQIQKEDRWMTIETVVDLDPAPDLRAATTSAIFEQACPMMQSHFMTISAQLQLDKWLCNSSAVLSKMHNGF